MWTGGTVTANLKPGTAKIYMLGCNANVNVYCNHVHQGLLTFRDNNKNMSISISKADPVSLASFLESIRGFLSNRRRKYPFPEKIGSESVLTKRSKPMEIIDNAKEAENYDSKLSKEQQEAIRIALSGKSFFLTGGAGTGKSMVLGEIIKSLPKKTTFITGLSHRISSLKAHLQLDLGLCSFDGDCGL